MNFQPITIEEHCPTMTYDFKVSYLRDTYLVDILIISFHGEYRYGSGGSPDAGLIRGIIKTGVSVFHPFGVIINFTDFEYNWGDDLDLSFEEAGPTSTCVVVGEKCRAAFSTLEFGVESTQDIVDNKLFFDNIDEAIAALKNDDVENHRTFKNSHQRPGGNKLIIDTDKEVTIDELLQRHVYSGLLEGMPTTKMNRQIVADAKAEAKKFCGIEEIYLIEPKQTPIPYEGKYPFGEPSALPPIMCMAKLLYHGVFRNAEKDYAALALVWFQEDFAFRIADEILENVKQIPFSKICGEFRF